MLANRWRRSRSVISKRSCAMRASRAANARATEVPSGKSSPARSRGAMAVTPPDGGEGRGGGLCSRGASPKLAAVLRTSSRCAGRGPATGTGTGAGGEGRRRGSCSALRESSWRTATEISRDSRRVSRASSRGVREESEEGAESTRAMATAGCVPTGLETSSPARSPSVKAAAGEGSRASARAARTRWISLSASSATAAALSSEVTRSS